MAGLEADPVSFCSIPWTGRRVPSCFLGIDILAGKTTGKPVFEKLEVEIEEDQSEGRASGFVGLLAGPSQ